MIHTFKLEIWTSNHCLYRETTQCCHPRAASSFLSPQWESCLKYSEGQRLYEMILASVGILHRSAELHVVHPVPRITSANSSGLVTWSGRWALTARSIRLDLSPSRVGHTEMKWWASSTGALHSLQDSSFEEVSLFLRLNLAASFSRPSHPTNRRILKLFARFSWVAPRVTVQCCKGRPTLRSQPLM